jgi:hypothetical protein
MVDEEKASPCDSHCRTDFQNEVDHYIEVGGFHGSERTRDFSPSASTLRRIEEEAQERIEKMQKNFKLGTASSFKEGIKGEVTNR